MSSAQEDSSYQMERGIDRKEIRKVLATWTRQTRRMGQDTGRIQPPTNPEEWTLENIPRKKQLDQITVRDITIAPKTHKEPGCKTSWENTKTI